VPIVLPPAVAILGAGKVRHDAVAVGDGASAHAALIELRSPLHHRRRGVPLPGGGHFGS
jgi:pyruvate/2-oxoglutarate dehydrogenase complex dihydrolipoamide acyltransferase (E2) component